MASEAALVKETKDRLEKFVKRPPLAEKYLSKPPFRFLHDVISAAMKEGNLFEGLFEDSELVSTNLTDTEARSQYLTKVIDCLSFATETTLQAKPAKILGGKEADKTNLMLQALATVLENKIDTTPSVERVLAGEKPAKSGSKKGTADKNRGKKTDSSPKSRAKDKPSPSNKKENRDSAKRSAASGKRGKPETTPTKSPGRGLSGKSQSSASRSRRPSTISQEPKEPDVAEDGDSARPDEGENNNNNNEERMDSMPSETGAAVNIDDSSNGNGMFDMENGGQDGEDVEVGVDGAGVEAEDAEKAGNQDASPPQLTPEEEEPPVEQPKIRQPTARQRAPGSARPKTVRDRQPPKEQEPEVLGGDDIEERSDMQSGPPAGPTRPPSAARAGSARPVTGRPRSARPPSARPAAPRLKEKREIAVEEQPRPPTAQVANLILDNEDQDDEEDNEFVIEEAPKDPLALLEGGANAEAEVLENHGEGHGALVQKILETQMELQDGNKINQPVEIEREEGAQPTRHRDRESSHKEVEKLKTYIQTLARSANPLGKLMDFLQEDVDSMQRELENWRSENNKLQLQLRHEENLTQQTLQPLTSQLTDLTGAVQDQLDKISVVKCNLLRNEDRIGKMISSIGQMR